MVIDKKINKQKFTIVAEEADDNKNMADSSRNEKPLEPCRACHDFKSWSKLRKKEMDKSTVRHITFLRSNKNIFR